MIEIAGKKVSVIGFGRSGMSAVKLLKKYGAEIFVSDKSTIDKFENGIKILDELNIKYEFGEHTDKILNADFVILSPGVPLKNSVLAELKNSSIPIYSEIELGSWFCKGTIIGISGSNGKSTTATLTYELFKNANYKSHLAGNIGTPFTDIVENVKKDEIVVLELSNFQLENIASFTPFISVMLNLTPDHLDRYDKVEDYYEAKLKMWLNQNENCYAVIRRDDSVLFNYMDRCKARPLWFAREYFDFPGAYAYNGFLIRKNLNGKEERIIELDKLGIIGPHNQWNSASSICATIPYNLEIESLKKTLMEFKGIEHRIEFVRELDNVKYYNDSKSTNPDSLNWALQSFNNPIILIAGGLDKGTDFSFLKPLIAEKTKMVILLGKAKDIMKSAWSGATEIKIVKDLNEAVITAQKYSDNNDIVLLSPGCASFDMFKNFEHRGQVFKDFVNNLRSKDETGSR